MENQAPLSPENSTGENSYSSKERERYFNDHEARRRIAQRRQILDRIFYAIVGTIGILFFAAIIIIVILSRNLPSLEQLENPKPQLATEVYSADGVLLTKFFNQNRTVVRLDSISPHVIHALIATEDVGFYEHWGLDAPRLMRAMVENIGLVLRGRRARGASTITQQLARNLWLTPERSLSRKLQELLISIQIERTYTKDEILSLYLNTVYFGEGAYGVEAAAWTYFAKPASQLTVPESALLVAALKEPARYNPVKNPKDALARRNLVISLMERAKFITAREAERYRASKIELHYTPVTDLGIAPYFTEYVRRQLQSEAEKHKFDLYRDGLVIYTTLDTRMQAHAEQAIQRHLPVLQNEFNKNWKWESKRGDSLRTVFIKESDRFKELITKGLSEKEAIRQLKNDKGWLDTLLYEKTVVQVAFVAIEPSTGHIKAWVGGTDFVKYKFDHVWQAKRQPGSTFKPFVYTGAIDQGIPPNYKILNQPIAIKTPQKMWMPENSEKDVGGLVTLRDALANSMNLVTIRLAQAHVPPAKIAQYARRMGIQTPLEENLALALGASVVTPLEMTSAYGTFANNGVHVSPISILRIEDRFGNVILSNKPVKREALNPATNYVMVTMLKGVMDRGTGAAARSKYNFRYEAGGKTGTTQEQGDAWFMGFTPQLVAGVWTGFDDQRIKFTSMSYGQGSRAALPIWAMFMKACYDDKSLKYSAQYFARPSNVYTRLISLDTNQPTDASSPRAYVEFFTEACLRRYASLIPGADSLRLNTPISLPTASKKRGEGEY
ncbi:MAG: penicillin-binding protein 1A [Candidatus Thermochlorobacter sp.]